MRAGRAYLPLGIRQRKCRFGQLETNHLSSPILLMHKRRSGLRRPNASGPVTATCWPRTAKTPRTKPQMLPMKKRYCKAMVNRRKKRETEVVQLCPIVWLLEITVAWLSGPGNLVPRFCHNVRSKLISIRWQSIRSFWRLRRAISSR